MRNLIYIILFFSTLFCACHKEESAVAKGIALADSLINVSLADSAFKVLDSLDVTDADAETRAHHALLKSKVSSIVFYRKFDDSLLSLAADYYYGRGDSLDLQAQYLFGAHQGYQRGKERDYNRTSLALKYALDLAEKLCDTLYTAKIYRSMAASPISGTKERGDYSLKAGRAYQSIGRLNDAISCLSTAVRNFNTNGEDSLAIALLLEIREIADSVTDYIAVSDYNMALYRIRDHYLTKSDMDRLMEEAKARRLSEIAKQAPLNIKDSTAIHIRGTGLIVGSSGEKHKPTVAINDSILNLIIERSKWSQDSFKFRNTNEARANFLSSPYTKLLDQHYRSIIDNQQLVEQQSQLRIKLLIALTALLAVLAVIIYLIYSRRLRDRKLQLLSLVNDIDNLRLDLSQLQNQVAEQTEQNLKLHPYQLIDSLCELRHNAPTTAEGERVLGRNVTRFIDKLNSPDVIEEIETFVNAYRSDIMVKFREQFHKLTQRQYNCALLIFAGFSGSSISALLTYPSYGAYRTERSRLKQMIEQSASPDKSIFLTFFNQ